MCNNIFPFHRLTALYRSGSAPEPRAEDAPTRRQVIAKALALGSGLTLMQLFGLPEMADAFNLFRLPSFNDQKKLGLQAEQQILQQYQLVTDSRASEVKSVGANLVAALTEPDKSRWNYDFHLIKSDQINAFALPGGPLFFFSGLYDNMTTEDELAAVVGHEMTHVRLQHWAHAYQKQEQNDLFLGIGEALGHVSNIGQQVLGFANDTWSLSYSREEEAQADHGGLQDMVSAGYNPNGMIDMFHVLLKKIGNGGNSASVYLANHPLTTDRIKAAQQQITTYGATIQFPSERPIGSAAGIVGEYPIGGGHPSAGSNAPGSPPAAKPSPAPQPSFGAPQGNHPATDM